MGVEFPIVPHEHPNEVALRVNRPGTEFQIAKPKKSS